MASTDLTVVAMLNDCNELIVLFSPGLAEHHPNYVALVSTASREVADAVMKAALIVEALA